MSQRACLSPKSCSAYISTVMRIFFLPELGDSPALCSYGLSQHGLQAYLFVCECAYHVSFALQVNEVRRYHSSSPVPPTVAHFSVGLQDEYAGAYSHGHKERRSQLAMSVLYLCAPRAGVHIATYARRLDLRRSLLGHLPFLVKLIIWPCSYGPKHLYRRRRTCPAKLPRDTWRVTACHIPRHAATRPATSSLVVSGSRFASSALSFWHQYSSEQHDAHLAKTSGALAFPEDPIRVQLHRYDSGRIRSHQDPLAQRTFCIAHVP